MERQAAVMNEEQREVGTARIAKGVAILDVHAPGWQEEIDPEALDLRSLTQCVLGQVFGGFGDGMEALFGSVYAEMNAHSQECLAARYGFESAEDVTYAVLTELWRERLAAYELVSTGGA